MTNPEIPPFETTFAVPLSCDSCIQSVSKSLYSIPGIHNVSASLSTQLISITGTAAPSAIVKAIESTGRDAILRGSGQEGQPAAVAILETHKTGLEKLNGSVKGLVRMVQVADEMTIVDVGLKGVEEGVYHVTVRENGDVSRGAERTGGVWGFSKARGEGKGVFGSVAVGRNGLGSAFLDRPVRIWEMIGRSIVVSREGIEGPFEKEDENTLVGVVARSAGVWDNDKTVCSCSGKTVWEERKEQREKGML